MIFSWRSKRSRTPERGRRSIATAAAWLVAGPLACRPESNPPTPLAEPPAAAAPYVAFERRKAEHTTALTHDGPSPGRFSANSVPPGATAVSYASGNHELLAWLAMPPNAQGPVPAVIYFHGAFSLVPDDFEAVRPFLDAGLAVLTPALRGENGNPGRLELLYGEVDDAVAAVQWLATQPGIDGEHLYAIGHSVGGGIAAMVSLRADAPLRIVGSVGGIYVPETFQRWSRSESNAGLVRFDPFDVDEGSLRTLGPNLRDLVHPHTAYIGEQDRWFHPNADAVAREAERFGVPFEVVKVPGGHMDSLQPALADFLERVREDLTDG